MPPELFGRTTPRQFATIMRGKQWAREEFERSAIAHAWYVEAFRRTKRLPDLEHLLSPPGENGQQSDGAILAVLLAMKEAGANMVIEEVDASWLQQ